MAYPLPVTPQPLIPPAARPLLAIGLLPALAGRYFDYLPLGGLAGDVLTYRDVSAYGWWTPVNLYAATQANVSEDAGSIFEAVAAIAIDASINEAYPWGTPIESGDPLLMVEAFTPEQPSFQYYAVRTRNSDLRVTTTGETIMGRLARTIPPRLMVRVADIHDDDTMPAGEAIQYILDQWEARYPWFGAESVPDLRLLVDEAVGNERQYYIDNPDAGLVTTGALVIPQDVEGDRDERRTMREIIDEWLAIFPGTIVRANSAGRLEIVPRVGPDAPQIEKHLVWADIRSISDGENDPRGITNQARVVSRGFTPEEETPLIEPSFLVFTGEQGITRALLDSQEVLPDDRSEASPWSPIPFVALGSDDAITVDIVITAFGSWNRTTASAWSVEGTQSRTIALTPGESKEVTITHNSRSQTVTARFNVTRASTDSLIITATGNQVPSWADNAFGRTYFAYLLEVDAEGTAWVKGNRQVSGQFGYLPGDTLPGPDGTDALAESIAKYGERGATINSSIFQLTPEMAQMVARAYVLQNINPRTVRDVEQTLWRQYPIRFDDIGRPVELPSGEVAIVEHRDYAFASTEGNVASASSFSAVVTSSVLDTETAWLYFSNGTFFELDDGTQAEES